MASFTINRTLLPIKAHYVLFWGGLAGIVPFVPTLLQNIGISASAIGIVFAVLPFIKMISKPLFGGVADKFQQHRAMFLVSKFVMTCALFTMYFIPVPSSDVPSSSAMNSSILLADFSNSSSSSSSHNVSVLERVCGGHVSHPLTLEFVLICVCLVVGWMAMAVAENTGDVIVLEQLGDEKRGFGRERLWGSLSWGLIAAISGLLIDHASRGKDYVDFSPGFIILLFVGVLDVVVSTRVKTKKAARSEGLAKKIGDVFRHSEIVIFTTQVFVVGCFTGVCWSFLVVYLNTLGASQLLIGLTMASQCFLGETPFFFIADWCLDRIGHANAVTLTLAVFSLRFVLYFAMVNPWLVLAIEVTQGINYGLFFTALATYSSLIAPAGAEATVQGIEQAVFEGFGVGIGSLIAGFLFDSVGGAHMFLYFGIFAAIFTGITVAVRLWISSVAASTKKRKRPVSIPNSGIVENVGERRSLTMAKQMPVS